LIWPARRTSCTTAPSASRQTTSLENIFEEEPVPLDIFVRDRKFLGNPDLGSYQFDAVRHIERVYLPDLYPLMAQEFDPYWGAPIPMKNVFTLEWGKGEVKITRTYFNFACN
jgi:hypothetical protein